MEIKIVVAMFDLSEHTGAVEDRLITDHISKPKKEGFRSASNTLIRINKENLYKHETDMFNQIIVMARGERENNQESHPIYTRH